MMANIAALLFFVVSGVYIGLVGSQYMHGHPVSMLSVILFAVFFILGIVMLTRARNLRIFSQTGKTKQDE